MHESTDVLRPRRPGGQLNRYRDVDEFTGGALSAQNTVIARGHAEIHADCRATAPPAGGE